MLLCMRKDRLERMVDEKIKENYRKWKDKLKNKLEIDFINMIENIYNSYIYIFELILIKFVIKAIENITHIAND